MLSGADNYVSNPSVDYDVHKIIFAGKERSAKCINLTKNAWDSDMFGDLLKNNHSHWYRFGIFKRFKYKEYKSICI